jgi:hypothetical protein
VVGELGMHGTNVTNNRVRGLRLAQQNVCLKDEFLHTTRFIRTAPFAVLNGINYDGIHHYNGRADTYFHAGTAFGNGMIDLFENP